MYNDYNDHDDRHVPGGPSRRRIVQLAAAGAAGLALAAGAPFAATASGAPGRSPGQSVPAPGVNGCADTKSEVLDALLLAERVAATFYYTGLTTGAISAPATRDGRVVLSHIAYVRRALAEEQAHAGLWRGAGAEGNQARFYFPATTFTRLGYTGHGDVFLGVLDYLETVLVGVYLTAIGRLGVLGHINMAVMAVQILQTECTHRVLGRAIAGDSPADNVTLEVESLSCSGDALDALRPFITGHGFHGGVTPAIALPTDAQVARVTR